MAAKKRILIIDDSPVAQRVLSAKLKESGFEVLHAPEGIAGINAARTEMPDLVLLDVNMPIISGYQVCRLLKDNPATRAIPVIIMTDLQGPQMAADPKTWSAYMGADGYIDKQATAQGKALAEAANYHLSKIAENPLKERFKPLTQTQVLSALSQTLDRQFYKDITHLMQLNEKKSHFVANVSHEFKSPLTLIKGNLENIQEGYCGETNEPQQKALGSALRAVTRLSRLVMDLLDLARIETGKMTLKNELLSLSELIESVLQIYGQNLQEREIKITKKFDPELPPIMGDPERLIQVLTNLVNNALKYTPPRGQIFLSALRENSHVRFEIEDSGPGIDKKNLEKIFDKFERVTTNKEEGTGLGLPIAREIVTLHGGKLWAESDIGRGVKFIFVLPVSREREREREWDSYLSHFNSRGF